MQAACSIWLRSAYPAPIPVEIVSYCCTCQEYSIINYTLYICSNQCNFYIMCSIYTDQYMYIWCCYLNWVSQSINAYRMKIMSKHHKQQAMMYTTYGQCDQHTSTTGMYTIYIYMSTCKHSQCGAMHGRTACTVEVLCISALHRVGIHIMATSIATVESSRRGTIHHWGLLPALTPTSPAIKGEEIHKGATEGQLTLSKPTPSF